MPHTDWENPAESPVGSSRARKAGPPAAFGSTACEMLSRAIGSASKAWASACCLAATAPAKASRLVTLVPRAEELVAVNWASAASACWRLARVAPMSLSSPARSVLTAARLLANAW